MTEIVNWRQSFTETSKCYSSLKCISMYIQMLHCRFRRSCFKKNSMTDCRLILECLDIKFHYNFGLNTYIYISFFNLCYHNFTISSVKKSVL